LPAASAAMLSGAAPDSWFVRDWIAQFAL